jgi:hypothetical protein
MARERGGRDREAPGVHVRRDAPDVELAHLRQQRRELPGNRVRPQATYYSSDSRSEEIVERHLGHAAADALLAASADQVRVGIDEPRQDQAACGVDDLPRKTQGTERCQIDGAKLDELLPR